MHVMTMMDVAYWPLGVDYYCSLNARLCCAVLLTPVRWTEFDWMDAHMYAALNVKCDEDINSG